MIRVGITLLITASVSYGLLPMIKPIGYWTSTGIFACLVVACVLIENRNRGDDDLALDAVRQAIPTPTAPDPADKMAEMFSTVMSAVGGMGGTSAAPDRPLASKVMKPATPDKAMGFYAVEAATLTQLLQTNHGLNVVVEPTGFVKAPRFVAYRVRTTGPVRAKKLTDAENDLAREINDIHRNYRFGKTEIIFTDTQPIWLQISNPKPTDLNWEERHTLWNPKPLQAILGHYYNGATATPLIVDIGGKDTSYTNGAWFGQPGSGKSTSLHEALCSLIEHTPATQLQVWGIDLSKDVFRLYEGLPHLAQHTRDIDEAIAILDQFWEWCRAGGAPTDGVTRLLVMDECQDLVTHHKYGKAVQERLADILSKGREFGIRVWMATQNPDQNSYPSTFKPKTHFMACGHILNDNYVSSQLGIYGASKIVEKQELIFQGPVGMFRVSMFRFTGDQLDRMIDTLIQRWGYSDYRQPTPIDYRKEDLPPVAALAITPVIPAATPMLGAHKRWDLPHRALTEGEGNALIAMVKTTLPDTKLFHHRGKVSINKVIAHVYRESKNQEKIDWIKDHLARGGILSE